MAEEPSKRPDTGPGGDSDSGPDAPAASIAARRSPWIGIVAALLVGIVAIYIWKLVAVSDVRGEMAAARDSLQERSLRALDERTHELLRLSVVPLGWAIRSEMLRRDYQRVDAFLAEFVQEPGVRRAVLGIPRDSILVSSDKSIEGEAFSAHFPGELLRLNEPVVAERDPPDAGYRIAVPILGPTRSLGVLVVDYRPEQEPLRPPPTQP